MSIIIGFITFVCVFGGAIFGMYLRSVLPDHHLKDDSKDAMKAGMAIVATLSALVLGLLISSAKSSLDSTNAALTESGAKIIMLDRILRFYGPDANEARAQLLGTVQAIVDRMGKKDKPANIDRIKMPTNGKVRGMELIVDGVRALKPSNDSQQQLRTHALQLGNEIMLTRWLVMEQTQILLPTTFLVILIFWLTMLFISSGLFSPYNTTVIIVLFVCALSVSLAIFLIEDISQPFEGLIRASTGPLMNALESLSKQI
jgi:hypothetical protein